MAKRFAAFLALGVTLVLASGAASAAERKQEKQQLVEPKPVQLSPSPQGPANAITQGMFNAGVMSCATQVNRITNFLMGEGQTGAFLFVPKKNPDQMIVSVSMEIAATNTPVAYASASFAPGTAIGCGGMYEAVTYWNGTCQAVAEQIFKGAKPAGVLRQNIAILDVSASARVFLMPAGQGCVSIKKEVLQ